MKKFYLVNSYLWLLASMGLIIRNIVLYHNIKQYLIILIDPIFGFILPLVLMIGGCILYVLGHQEEFKKYMEEDEELNKKKKKTEKRDKE